MTETVPSGSNETPQKEDPNHLVAPDKGKKRSNSVADLFEGQEFTETKIEPSINKAGSEDGGSPRKVTHSTSLRDQLKATLNKGGDISDIDKIFEHVLNESKRVNESLKLVNIAENESDPRKSFLKFYETASKGEIEEEMKEFIDIEQGNKVVKSEAYYCTKHGRVKGVLTVSDTYIMYDPLY